MMAAAAVLQAQLADIDGGRLVHDGLADHHGGVLLAEAPGDVHGDLGLGIEGVDHEAVARVDDLLVAQVQHDHLVVKHGDALELLHEHLGLLEVQVHALLDVRQGQDLVDVVLHAEADQLHHQVIVGDAELAEAAQAGAGIHQVVQQHPSLGMQYLIHGEIGAVALVHRLHQLVADVGEGFLAAIVVVDHPCRAAGVGVDDQLAAGLLGLQAMGRLVVMSLAVSSTLPSCTSFG